MFSFYLTYPAVCGILIMMIMSDMGQAHITLAKFVRSVSHFGCL